MFGPRLSTVFASRWKALWWSAIVLLTAYCTVPSSEEAGTAAQQAQSAPDNSWVDDAPPFADDQNLRELQELRRKLP